METSPPAWTLRPDPKYEAGLLQTVLDFANTGEPSLWLQLHQRANGQGPSPDLLLVEQDALRAALESLLHFPQRPGPNAISTWSARVRDLSPSIAFDPDFGDLLIELRVKDDEPFKSPPSPILAYALLRLTEYSRPLRRCAYCRKYFIEQRTRGMTRTIYCEKSHMEAAHRAAASERVRRSREQKRALLQQRKRRKK